jgi:hypothetical protein
MRNGIVQGEPGIFPWPTGRFFHWISRKMGHHDPAPAPSQQTPAPPGDPSGGELSGGEGEEVHES